MLASSDVNLNSSEAASRAEAEIAEANSLGCISQSCFRYSSVIISFTSALTKDRERRGAAERDIWRLRANVEIEGAAEVNPAMNASKSSGVISTKSRIGPYASSGILNGASDSFSTGLAFHSVRKVVSCQDYVRKPPSTNRLHRPHKPLRIRPFSFVEPEGFLVQVSEEVKPFHGDVCTLDRTTKQAPEVFRAVRLNEPAHPNTGPCAPLRGGNRNRAAVRSRPFGAGAGREPRAATVGETPVNPQLHGCENLRTYMVRFYEEYR